MDFGSMSTATNDNSSPLPTTSTMLVDGDMVMSTDARCMRAASRMRSPLHHSHSHLLNSASRRQSSSRLERRMRLDKVGMYRVGRTLGRGNFAQVRLAYHEVANSKVAMKIVDKRSLDAENLTKIEREIEVLQKLRHPFIVKLYEVIRTEKFLYIITEYVNNGELFDMLMDRGRQAEDEARRLFQQIVSAVAYCHARGIVHRDLKAENLLLDRKGNIKLIDFGFSNYQRQDALLSTWCGSPPYAAPELLLAQEYDGRMSDVWSLGVILYILVTAGFPFPGDSVDKLKRAVLGDHLKIPFWVSVECSDLIRKMLTVSPAKRISLHAVTQHRWFTGCGSKLPTQIRNLLVGSERQEEPPPPPKLSPISGGRSALDPTLMVFMQQHTAWGEEQIVEEVLARNYESPIFATYELLKSKLDALKEADSQQLAVVGSAAAMAAAAATGEAVVRRGSRGSIISGKANLDGSEPAMTAIPTHHLAKLTLSISPDYYDSDDSSAASDKELEATTAPSVSSTSHSQQHTGGGAYKSYRRTRLRRRDLEQQEAEARLTNDARRNTLGVIDPYKHQPPLVNPLLSAAAQQFATIDTRAWANAAAAAALFATQLHANTAQMSPAEQHQQLQQAALNLVSLQNYPPLADYARNMAMVPGSPNQERRASANEALIGLNSYAHMLAAYSTMGIYAGSGAGCTAATTPDRAGSSASNNPTTRYASAIQTSAQHAMTARQQTAAQRRSVEEEAENYLTQRGAAKRNTVHAVAGTSQLPATLSSGGAAYAHPYHHHHPQQQQHHRHSQKPYSKQNGSVGATVAAQHPERRSSWASTTMSSMNAAAHGLNISAQQQAQLEQLYRQSLLQSAAANDAASTGLSGVQQLQLEFQKLCASTNSKDSSPVPSGAVTAANYGLLQPMGMELCGQMPSNATPMISITDENNQALVQPTSAAYETVNFMPFASTSTSCPDQQTPHVQQQEADITNSNTSGYPRPATVIGFNCGGGVGSRPASSASSTPSSTEPPISSSVKVPSGVGGAGVCYQQTVRTNAGGSVVSGRSASITGAGLPQQTYQPTLVAKCVYVPVSISVAMERLQRVTAVHGLRYEVEPNSGEDSVKVRIAPAAGTGDEAIAGTPSAERPTTILEMCLFRMDQSPNISKSTFEIVSGEATIYEQMRQLLLSTFNEVC